MDNNVSIICIAVAVVIAGLVNMQQDSKIKVLTERVYQLEQTK